MGRARTGHTLHPPVNVAETLEHRLRVGRGPQEGASSTVPWLLAPVQGGCVTLSPAALDSRPRREARTASAQPCGFGPGGALCLCRPGTGRQECPEPACHLLTGAPGGRGWQRSAARHLWTCEILAHHRTALSSGEPFAVHIASIWKAKE